ncbi:hypothetical protein M440DRAFT_1083912 [Trichoderma longibrachiatum ATCC 18648]|uniref:Uncharacterized protein n=1 Tax=Trichoderma longibrachiatum ATCC 18648 TaxID=983965 RepID=A0A2T4BU14_TRILO|nr:hypothetical protein M440DRAFT_1083912 [Trichoderma longibrachiatum ATCC 18648]
MSSPQPQVVEQQMTAEAPARISSDQPRPVEPMSMDTTASMRGGEGEKGQSLTLLCVLHRPSAAASALVWPASSAASAPRTAANASSAKR